MAKTKKLVRDKIPQKILNSGEGVTVRVLDWEEWDDAIWAKIREELKELKDSLKPDPDTGLDFNQIAIEAADVLEALHALVDDYVNPDQVEEVRQERLNERGGFNKRLYLETIHKRGLAE